jgi:large subunit ribosomal protein L3
MHVDRRRTAMRPDEVIPWWDRQTATKMERGAGVWAEKLNSVRLFEDDGTMQNGAILVIKRGGNIVTGKRWPEKHGYYALQVGYNRYVPQEWEKTVPGRRKKLQDFAEADLPPMQWVKEFRVRPQDWKKYEIGDKIDISKLFKEGDKVDILGQTKDMGFRGRVAKYRNATRHQRHGRGPMTHGSKHHNRIGSMGAGTGTARVFPGKKGAGHKGARRLVVKRKILKIMDKIDEDNMPETIMVVNGPIPGYNAFWKEGGSPVVIQHALNWSDGRHKQDPVWLWYVLSENDDPYVPMPGMAWTYKSYWGRDIRFYKAEEKKYWPDGIPGFDHSTDPFYDDCDPHKAIKAPEW